MNNYVERHMSDAKIVMCLYKKEREEVQHLLVCLFARCKEKEA